MKKAEIKVGGYYKAKVSGNIVTVRVDDIEDNNSWPGRKASTRYAVTNLKTGRKTTFRSAAKFRSATEKNPILKQFGTQTVEAAQGRQEMAKASYGPTPLG